MADNLKAISQEMMDAINKFKVLPLRNRQSLFVNCMMIFDKVYCDYINQEKHDDNYAFWGEALQYGYPIFIRFFYDPVFEDLEGVPLQALTPERLKLCTTLIAACSTYGWIEDIKENIKYQNLRKYDFGNYTRIKFLKKYHWNEYLDKNNNLFYSSVMSFALQKQYAELNQRTPSILEKIREHVYVWRDYFIGYTTDIEIEDYFYAHAELDAQQETKWEMFNGNNTFGHVLYSDYVNSIVDFSCYAIKHIYFAHTLKTMHPHLLVENFFYLCREKPDLINLIAENRNISIDKAQTILRCLSLGKHNATLYSRPMYCHAPFIMISKTQALQTIAGTLYEPYAFLLENLHYAFPKAWDANVNSRETDFKNELYSIFKETKYTCIKRPVNISNTASRKTDIDAAIIDKSSGEIALFQLKWQDHTHTSSRSLHSKSTNYNEKAKKWVESVREWIATAPTEEMSAVLGIPKKHIDKSKIYLFILGRNHGNYSGNRVVSDNCAWAQWYQFLRISQDTDKALPQLSQVYHLVRKDSPFNKHYKEKPILHKFGKHKIIFGNWSLP